jgi:hypothetical protein
MARLAKVTFIVSLAHDAYRAWKLVFDLIRERSREAVESLQKIREDNATARVERLGRAYERMTDKMKAAAEQRANLAAAEGAVFDADVAAKVTGLKADRARALSITPGGAVGQRAQIEAFYDAEIAKQEVGGRRGSLLRQVEDYTAQSAEQSALQRAAAARVDEITRQLATETTGKQTEASAKRQAALVKELEAADAEAKAAGSAAQAFTRLATAAQVAADATAEEAAAAKIAIQAEREAKERAEEEWTQDKRREQQGRAMAEAEARRGAAQQRVEDARGFMRRFQERGGIAGNIAEQEAEREQAKAVAKADAKAAAKAKELARRMDAGIKLSAKEINWLNDFEQAKWNKQQARNAEQKALDDIERNTLKMANLLADNLKSE